MHPNTKQETKSHEPSSSVADSSKLHAAGLVQPGSAQATELNPKKKNPPNSIKMRREARIGERCVLPVKAASVLKSMLWRQSMELVFRRVELVKIRNIPNEITFFNTE